MTDSAINIIVTWFSNIIITIKWNCNSIQKLNFLCNWYLKLINQNEKISYNLQIKKWYTCNQKTATGVVDWFINNIWKVILVLQV